MSSVLERDGTYSQQYINACSRHVPCLSNYIDRSIFIVLHTDYSSEMGVLAWQETRYLNE